MEVVVVVLIVVFLSAFLQSLSGFGFSLLAVPVLTFFLSMQDVTPLLVLLCMYINTVIAYKYRKHLNVRAILPLIVTSGVFTPAGVWLLLILPDAALKTVVGIVTSVFAVCLLAGFRLKITHENRWLYPIGMVSGLLNGSITMAGPPVILFLANQQEAKNTFRAKLATYFLTLNVITMITYFASGLMTTKVLKLAAAGSIPLILGVFMGVKLADKVSEAVFGKMVLVIILATGLLGFCAQVV